MWIIDRLKTPRPIANAAITIAYDLIASVTVITADGTWK
jgi:hypothetical protein